MSPPLRVSDADREVAADRLRRGMGEGRLSVEELEERLDAAYRAQTRAELDRLVGDLPGDLGDDMPAASAVAPRVPVMAGGAGGTGWVVSVLGESKRKGRWRLAARCRVINVMGGSELDLVDVELAADSVELTVFSIMGESRIRLPESLRVEVSKFGLMGGYDVDLGSGPTDLRGPVMRLRLFSIMGGGEVRRAGRGTGSGRRRRQWLSDGATSEPGDAEKSDPSGHRRRLRR